jgi:hypothetical protein
LHQHLRRGVQSGGHGVDRRDALRRGRDRFDEQLLQRSRAPEQNLALVGEVAEERPLGQPRALRDLGDRGLREAALAVELQRGLLEPSTRVWLPSSHRVIVAMTAADMCGTLMAATDIVPSAHPG